MKIVLTGIRILSKSFYFFLINRIYNEERLDGRKDKYDKADS
jgi:hypothetical protein